MSEAARSGACIYRKIITISAVRVIGRSRSGPANNLSIRHTSLYFAAALQTRQNLPVLFGFTKGGCGNYCSFPKLPMTSNLAKIFANLLSTSVSIDC